MTFKQEWAGKKVAVIGLGIEGEDLARYFATHGARVVVSDLKSPAQLEKRINALHGLDVSFSLGANDPTAVMDADLVCVSQGVPLNIAAVEAPRSRGVPVESMTSLFFRLYPGPICGITGSSGKTTTTALVDAIFGAAGRKRTLGGNIGIGLMSLLEDADPETWAVLEVSHSQLVLGDRSPHVASLLNVTPNHLDRFTWEEYVELKRHIFAYQSPNDYAVFNADDPVSKELRPQARARVFLFSMAGDPGADGAFLKDGSIYWRRGATEKVIDVGDIPLRGEHNIANVLAATATAAACDLDPNAVAHAVRDFDAPPHRIEFVRRVQDVDYYNDSIATTPERTLAALRSFDEPIVLLLGGRDKNLPLDSLEREIGRKCRAVICFGESALTLRRGVEGSGVPVEVVRTVAQAVALASESARPGDVVLLSPACTSFDAYDNYEQRGAAFREEVRLLAGEVGA
jgi:UDP-N-acetylmuramoylalanine--D-glutamate ligase